MAAPEGNQFWTMRSKHGRDKLFKTPDLMWEAACEYFKWCVDNPLMEVDFRGKDADQVAIPHMRPFTMQGLCFYLGCNTDYFRHFKNNLNLKENEEDKDFYRVIRDIEEITYMQKFEGAASGFLNANIISRDLGLKDNIEKTVQMNKKTTLTLKLNGGSSGNNIRSTGTDQPLSETEGDH